MGAFSELGWAWNTRPGYPLVARWKTRVPSAEFTESFVIWLYGASNVFMERMNAAPGPWSHEDFEHVSITLLFFGGGLLGMVVESSWLREFATTTVVVQKQEQDVGELGTSHSNHASAISAAEEHWQLPNTYRIPLNPLPGLIIMLLGIMMSGHHQDSMVSTMMHAQWGTLFVAFALARATTYILLYIKPPTSHFPARPPSEIIAAFCLTVGGFMFSARDCIRAIEGAGLNAMIVLTITLGLTGLVMAWTVVCFAVKGWAVRRERAATGRPLN
jgi:hypothetical protein